jgi:hypothetical protein
MYELLDAALAAGYADRAELASTPSLASFREEAEFRAILERLPPAP